MYHRACLFEATRWCVSALKLRTNRTRERRVLGQILFKFRATLLPSYFALYSCYPHNVLKGSRQL